MPAAPKPPPAPVVAPEPIPDKATLKAHHASLKRQTAPWWAAKLPGMREWAAIGFFLIAAEILRMIQSKPELLDSAPFMQFAGGLMAGPRLPAAASLFAGHKRRPARHS